MINDEVTIHSARFCNFIPSAIQRIAINNEADTLAIARSVYILFIVLIMILFLVE